MAWGIPRSCCGLVGNIAEGQENTVVWIILKGKVREEMEG